MVKVKLSVTSKSADLLAEKILDEVSNQIFNDSQRNIVDKKITDEGTLLKSGEIIVEKLKRTISYKAIYADIPEFGRNPGSMPPVQPIMNWVRRKGIAKTEKDIKRIAWAIAKDIKKNGLMPRPYLGPAIENAKTIRI